MQCPLCCRSEMIKIDNFWKCNSCKHEILRVQPKDYPKDERKQAEERDGEPIGYFFYD